MMRRGLYPGDLMPSNVIKVASHPWTRRSFDLGGMPLRLLVVDDNQNAATAMASYLSFESMECRVAFGGLDAIEIGTHWAPHVILMDISMPECNGYEATFALRQDQRTSGTVIVAFTALNDDGDVHKHLVDHSFDGYSQKGQPPSKLVALVMSFLH
ncbi:MAG: histidine kinase [Caballeronia sp.]|jgi:two-component system OmpR family response regulator|nr:histidine kinase [Caballeronia sp.]